MASLKDLITKTALALTLINSGFHYNNKTEKQDTGNSKSVDVQKVGISLDRIFEQNLNFDESKLSQSIEDFVNSFGYPQNYREPKNFPGVFKKYISLVAGYGKPDKNVKCLGLKNINKAGGICVSSDSVKAYMRYGSNVFSADFDQEGNIQSFEYKNRSLHGYDVNFQINERKGRLAIKSDSGSLNFLIESDYIEKLAQTTFYQARSLAVLSLDDKEEREAIKSLVEN